MVQISQDSLLVAIDTETTGLNREKNDRIIELGAVLINGREVDEQGVYSQRINPGKPIPADSTRIHRITDKMVENEPAFEEVVDDFVEFLEGRILVIHNAKFDLELLDQEFDLMKRSKSFSSNFQVFDTLTFAKKKHPSSSVSLNNLLKMYGIADENREQVGHSALLDSQLLARLYISLTGGQTEIGLNKAGSSTKVIKSDFSSYPIQEVKRSQQALERHQHLLTRLDQD